MVKYVFWRWYSRKVWKHQSGRKKS
jgi:hypothetical protein